MGVHSVLEFRYLRDVERAHGLPKADQRWRDIDRDNIAAGAGIITLRYNWSDVTRRPCEVASEVSAVLRQRGWTRALPPARTAVRCDDP